MDKVKVVALQAPVSDRESDEDHSEYISHARGLMDQQLGNEMMPRSAFWAPITASRYLSLMDIDGQDDFFSSDLTDEQLCERLGHVGRKKELDLIAVYSGKDEYVPSFVDKEVLLRRMVKAMNNGVEEEEEDNDGDGGDELKSGKEGNNARGLMLEDANHNLSKSEGDGARFVAAVGRLLSRW